MAAFNDNINARRLTLGLTYEEVFARMSERKYSDGVKPPSLSAVGNWFNGQRRPRHMEHLVALCDVLQVSIDEVAAGSLEPVTDTEVQMLKLMRKMGDAQSQALLAIASTLSKA